MTTPGFKALAAIVLIALMQPPASAQGKIFPAKGTVELGGSIGYESDLYIYSGHADASAMKTLSVDPFVGGFIDDGLELGLNPFSIAWTSYDGSTSTSIVILLAPSYNFKTGGNVYPFIEGLVGFTSEIDHYVDGGSDHRSGLSWGGRGGVKIAVTARTLLNVGLEYLQVTLNHDGDSSRSGFDRLMISAGFTIWFPGS